MAKDESAPTPSAKKLPPEAERALAEAAERRRLAEAQAQAQSQPTHREVNGPKGPEPTRYGDWERKGIASDF
jgi:hypothetical protein